MQGRRLGLNGPIPFADPSANGKIVAFRVDSKSGGGFNFTEATNFAFLPRQYAIPQSILDNIPGLDRFLHIPTDKEIHEALYGSDALPNQGEAANYGAPAYQQPQQPAQQAQPQYQAPAQNAPAPNANPYGAPAAGAPVAANPYGSAGAQVPHGQPVSQATAQPANQAPAETGYPEPTF